MIINITDFKIDDIVLYDPYDETDDIVKIDISTNKNQASILLQLEELTVLAVNDTNIMLSLKDKDYIRKFFNDIDAYIVSIIQEKKITKRLKTKFNYRQLLSGGDILNLHLNFKEDNDYITQIYQNKLTKLNDTDMILLLNNNGRASVIFELKSIILNKKDGIIYLENIVRQMKVKKLKPKRISNIKYSFVDSENSENLSDDDNKDDKDDKDDKDGEDEDEDDEEGYYKADDEYITSEEDNHKPRVDISTPKTPFTITFHIWQTAFNCNELEKQKKTFRRLFGSISNNTGLTIQGVFAALWQSQNIEPQQIQKIYIPNLFQCLATAILLHGPVTDKLKFIIFDTRPNIGNTIERYFLQFIRFLVILHKKMDDVIEKMRDDLSKIKTLKSGFVLNIREEKGKKIESVEILFERLTNIIDKLNRDGSDFITINGGIQLPILLSEPINAPWFEQYIQDELDHFLFMLKKRPMVESVEMIERVVTTSPYGNSLIRNNYKSPINPDDVFRNNKNIQTLEQFVKIIHSRNADGYSFDSDISVIVPSELIKQFFGNKSKTDQESVEGFILTTQRHNMEEEDENRKKWYKYTNVEMIPGIPRLNFENTITDCEIGCGYANERRCTQKIQKAKHINDPFTRGERYGIFPKKYRNHTRKVPNERGSFFPRINLFGPTYNRKQAQTQTQTQRQNGGKRSKNMRRRTHKRRNIT